MSLVGGVGHAFWACSKERWTRSGRPRLGQLPQAAAGMLAPNDRVTFVEPREKDVTEVDRPDAIVHFLEADGVGCERVTDEEQASFESERAGVRDALHEEVPGILDGRQSGIVRAGRRLIARRGRRPAQVFVRPLLIVLSAKPIEGPLLRDQRRARGTNGLGLERFVHALVRAILLWLARQDPLVLNAETHPPHIQLGESVNAGGCERDAIVGADRSRQAMRAKKAIKDRAHALAFGRAEPM